MSNQKTHLASASFARICRRVTKAALIDALWRACSLGNHEQHAEIEKRAMRELHAVILERGDVVPRALGKLS